MTQYLALNCRESSTRKLKGLRGERVGSMLATATATANAGKTQVRLSGSLFFSWLTPGISVSGENCAMRSETLVRMTDYSLEARTPSEPC